MPTPPAPWNSENQFRLFVERVKDYAVIFLDPEGRVESWNEGARRIKGYDASEIIGSHFSRFYTPEDIAKNHPETLLKTALEKGTVEEEGWRVRRDGSRFLADVVLTAVKDGQGVLRGFAQVTRDITERKKSEDDLRKSGERFQAILESAPDAMIITDPEGKMILANRQAEKLFGWPRAELLGKKIEMLVPEGFRQAHAGHRAAYSANPQLRHRGGAGMDLTGLRRDGSEVFLDISLAPLELEGSPCVVAAIRDFTLRKQAEAELSAHNQKLAGKNRDLEDFVSVASHDLQEPLRKIQVFGNFLMEDFVKGTAGKESRDYLDKMIRAARRMQTLIEDLLALARVTTKGRPFEAVPLSELLEEVLGDLESRIRETGGKVSADPLPVLEGDAVQLRQLFQNLLSNALKFHRKGIPPEVKVGAEILGEGPDPSGKRIRLTFADNGIGFDNKYSGQIFKAFERLHGQGEYAGTGIGLAICRRVVERHGGTITAEGFPGKGSLFTVTLPLSQPSSD